MFRPYRYEKQNMTNSNGCYQCNGATSVLFSIAAERRYQGIVILHMQNAFFSRFQHVNNFPINGIITQKERNCQYEIDRFA